MARLESKKWISFNIFAETLMHAKGCGRSSILYYHQLYYNTSSPVVLHIILVALLRPARKAREVGESSERRASYPSTGVGRGRAAVAMEL